MVSHALAQWWDAGVQASALSEAQQGDDGHSPFRPPRPDSPQGSATQETGPQLGSRSQSDASHAAEEAAHLASHEATSSTLPSPFDSSSGVSQVCAELVELALVHSLSDSPRLSSIADPGDVC